MRTGLDSTLKFELTNLANREFGGRLDHMLGDPTYVHLGQLVAEFGEKGLNGVRDAGFYFKISRFAIHRAFQHSNKMRTMLG
jgi:hypothetical protein